MNEEASKFPTQLDAVMLANASAASYMDGMMASWDAMRKAAEPYSWTVIRAEPQEPVEHRGHTIAVTRQFWKAPEKDGYPPNPFYLYPPQQRPDNLDENLSNLSVTTERIGEPGTYYALSVDNAKAYIDAELAIDADAERLGKIVEVLREMPCSCGEHGTVSDREYLRHAAEIVKVVSE